MKRMALIGIATLSVGCLLLVPNDAEAWHRHCRPRVHVHRTYHYVPSYTYDLPTYYAPSYYDYDYEPGSHSGYDSGYYDSYDYRPVRRSVRVYAPRPHVSFHYHGRARCSRRHTSIRFGW
jgi:hypothetical protein